MNISLIVVSILGLIFAFFGYYFRIMHWPLGEEMFFGGLSLFVVAMSWFVIRKLRPQ